MIKILKPPKCEPVSLERFKAYLEIDHTHFDDTLLTLLLSARERLEKAYERALISRTLSLSMRLSPARNKGLAYPGYAYHLLPGRIALRLPYPPLQHLEQVQVWAPSPTPQNDLRPESIPLDKICVNTHREPALIIIPVRWMPSMLITYRAGYGDDPENVPHIFKTSILQFAAYLFENRSGSLADLPKIRGLLHGFEGWRIG